MTERITPEQIATLRRLNEGRTQGPWLVDGPSASVIAASGRIIAKVATFLRHGSYMATVEDDVNQAFIAAAANCIIPALDEIERLQVIEKAASHMDAVMGSDRLGRNESAVISEAAVWLENALNGIRDEPELRYWYETLDAALVPPPAREEGVTQSE